MTSDSETRIKQALSALVSPPTQQAAVSQERLSPEVEAVAAAAAAGVFRPSAAPVSHLQRPWDQFHLSAGNALHGGFLLGDLAAVARMTLLDPSSHGAYVQSHFVRLCTFMSNANLKPIGQKSDYPISALQQCSKLRCSSAGLSG